jgi:3-(3-hydroxy-phenyl)propionate hydroxylase
MTAPLRTRVAVVGAGPVGAFAALRLSQLGIDVVLLEAHGSCPEDMRASTLHPPSIAMLETMGLRAELELQGLRAPIYHYRNRQTGEVIEFDLGEISDVTPYPYRLQCEQFKLARLATARLEAARPGSVLFNHRTSWVEQDAGGVTLHVETPIEMRSIRADYVIAADGANSTIRKIAGIPFVGFTYPERFMTLSTRYPIEDRIAGMAYVNYVADPSEWCVILRVPEFWRVLVPAAPEESDDALLSDARAAAVFAGLVGDASVETRHRTLYRVHQRVVETYRRGRILLAGDAAHLNNPLGGFGMNSGLHDAWNLVHKLDAIFHRGAAAEPELARYDLQRRTVMHEFIQSQTIHNKKMLEAGAAAQPRYQAEMKAISEDPERRREYLLRQAMIRSLEREAELG